MLEHDLNRIEWENPENWGGPRWMSVYFSKKDTRLWVPKQIPSFGWTLNLAHARGVVWLVGIFVGIILVQAAVTVAIALLC